MSAATILNSQSSTGFYKAPVCKGLMCSMFLTCTAIHVPMISSLRQYLICEIPEVLMSPSIWRLLFNRLTFIYSKDILCSALVLYYFRIFERRMGSRKFASYLLGSSTIATLLEIVAIYTLSHFYQDIPKFLPPGLYSIIFPLYVNYFLDIPKVNVSNFMGIPLTGKTITYLLGLQIASTSSSTLVSSICGIIAGILYRHNCLGVQKWLVVPKSVANFCDKAFGWFLYSKKPAENLPMGATLELQRQEQADRMEQSYMYYRAQDFRQSYAERLVEDIQQDGLGYLFRQRRPAGRNPGSTAPEPTEQNIQLLVDMGFERERAIQALRSSGNDLQSATTVLLHQQ